MTSIEKRIHQLELRQAQTQLFCDAVATLLIRRHPRPDKALEAIKAFFEEPAAKELKASAQALGCWEVPDTIKLLDAVVEVFHSDKS